MLQNMAGLEAGEICTCLQYIGFVITADSLTPFLDKHLKRKGGVNEIFNIQLIIQENASQKLIFFSTG